MEMVKLGDICEVLNGYAFKSDQYVESGIRVLRIANVQKGYIEDSTPAFYPEETNAIEKYMLKEGDLLMSLTGNVGRVGLLNKEFLPAALNQRVACLRLQRKNILKEYIFHFLNSGLFENHCIQFAKGVAQKNMSTEWLKDYMIPLYDIYKQREITTVLNKVSSIITYRKEQLICFDDLIKSRFVEMFGDQVTNPNNYEVIPFEELIEYMGDIGSNGANSVISAHLNMKDEPDYALMVRFLNFTSNDFTANVKYVTKETYEFFKKSQVFGGELIICKIGSAGLNYIMPYLNRPVSLGLNQIMTRTKDNINMTYLYTLLNTNYGKYLIDGCINGAVTKSITKGALKKIPIMYPPLDLQNQFATFVQQVDKLKFFSTKINCEMHQMNIIKKF